MTGRTPPSTDNTDPDEQFITMRAWLVADLLRLLNSLLDHLRTEAPTRLGVEVPPGIRDDLDYHVGLLRIRLHRAAQPHDKGHP